MAEVESMLKHALGRRVRVTVRGGGEFFGVLAGWDEQSNLYLEEVRSADGSITLSRAVFKGGNVNSVTEESSAPEESPDSPSD